MKFEDLNVGDILEFHHFHFDGTKHTQREETYIDRINCLTKNEGDTQNSDPHPEEIWFQHYGEMPGALYVTPAQVVRIIEKGQGPKWQRPRMILRTGTLVQFKDSGKTHLDRISGHEFRTDKKESEVRYAMEFSKYCMAAEEFEVLK